MPTSPLRLDILDQARQELLWRLLPGLPASAVLADGTAIALQLGHRLSYDFDFFLLETLPTTLSRQLAQVVTISLIERDTPDELTFFSANQVKCSVVAYPFTMPEPPFLADHGLRLYSLFDLTIQKAYTIGRRPAYRDYYDLYCLFHSQVITLPAVIAAGQKCYGSLFNPKLFLEQLTYFDDLPERSITPAPGALAAAENDLRHYFEQLVGAYIDTAMPRAE